MAARDVILLEIGQPAWRRWMVFHRSKNRYWSKGLWKQHRRDGELWHSKIKAEQELHVVQMGS
jgi:hypothetical protein